MLLRPSASSLSTAARLATLLATTALAAMPALGADISWDATGGSSQEWGTGANWVGGVTPTVGDNAHIEWSSAVLPTWQPRILAPDAATVDQLFIGTVDNSFGNLVVYNTLDVAGLADIGNGNAATGYLTVRGGTANLGILSIGVDTTTPVGLPAAGYLNVDSGGTLNIGGSASMGVGAAGSGSLVVKEASILTGFDLTVGDAGHATFSVLSDSTATLAGALLVGVSSTSSGTVLVDGSASTLSVAGGFMVGLDGQASMTVSGGGHVTANADSFIGNATGSGIVTITDAGSMFATTASLDIGASSTGELDLLNGGQATIGNALVVGDNSTGAGVLIIDGAGSSMTADDVTMVGGAGAGTLTITGGGVFTANDVFTIGAAANGNGTVTVSGAGSKLLAGGSVRLIVGDQGFGVLGVSAGGEIVTADLSIGHDSGSGLLEIASGGSVQTNGDVVIGNGLGTDDSAGLAMVDGGSWTVLGDMAIGSNAGSANSSSGLLAIRNGGTVSVGASYLFVGDSGGGVAAMGHVILGSGTLAIDNGAGVLHLGAPSDSIGILDIGGDTSDPASHPAADPGVLNVASVEVGDHGDGTLNFNHTSAGYIFAPMITGDGRVTSLAGTTILTGDSSSFSGETVVKTSKLVVNGSLGGDLYVRDGGILGGNGAVGNLMMGIAGLPGTGGIVAPGNSIGTLHVSGNLDMTAGSDATYEVELKAGGSTAGTHNDLIDVAGTATIGDGTIFHVKAENGTDDGSIYTPGTTYTVLQAAGGLTVAGLPTVTDDFAYLDFTWSDDPLNFYLTSAQDSVSFCLPGMTSNECATGNAVAALGSGNALYAGVLGQTVANAPVALDQLSGDAFASANGALAQGGLEAGTAALGRIDQAFASLDGGRPIGYAPLDGVEFAHSETNFWFTPYGSVRHANGDGNAPGSDTGSGGLLLGGDIKADGQLAGAFLSLGKTNISAASRGASFDSTDYGVGAYGGAEVGDFRLAIGAAYGRHQVSSSRTITAPGLGQTLTASYGANTLAGFGELSRAFDLGATELTPYGNATLVYAATDGFTETGGSAALTVAPASQLAALTTLGLAADWKLALDNGVLAKLSAGLGWQHGFGDAPVSVNAFAGGTSFTVAGQGLPRDAAVLKAGLDFDLSASAKLNFAYNGQIANEGSSHAATATLAVKF